MYSRGSLFDRKVKFVERDLSSTLTNKHFTLTEKNEGSSKRRGTKKDQVLLHKSSASSQVEGSSSSVNNNEEGLDDIREELKRGSTASEARKYSISSEFSEKKPERRMSLSLPKEKKPLKERRGSLSERRQSISSQSGGKKPGDVTPNEAGVLSITSSQASYTDDFIDNLTKQKLNLQLKGVADRMFEV